ncbi:hypothetical protein [Hymenobacter elongatus]|uniref:DUF3575 domain-containing protein n=1 Tax=Hymenobacter elongatus TaxID=877208 RepID=A0A4Z0PPX0_9BACT|nr:hypothetical protein [Hymenobacter elongatus]TGE19730.1 hypothetical protein E5J99_02925 [Hymenobacter elongatus]
MLFVLNYAFQLRAPKAHAVPRWLVAALLCGTISTNIYGQSPEPAAPGRRSSPGNNIVRLDLLSPLGYNMAYNLFADHGFVFPVLVSYERHLRGRWSVGTELLVNGGDPTDRRSGASLMARYYLLPARKTVGSLAGLYVSPVLNYRAMRTTDGYFGSTPSIVRVQRIGLGALLGWQVALNRNQAPRFVLDFAGGVLYRARLGADHVDDPYGYYTGSGVPRHRIGIGPDARIGLGYQF